MARAPALRVSMTTTAPDRTLDTCLQRLIETPNLDRCAADDPALTQGVFAELTQHAARAWSDDHLDHDREVAFARLVSQRALYRLYRLRLYWGDDAACYANERSLELARLLEQLERPWQRWLERRVPAFDDEREPELLLRGWAERDLRPETSEHSQWLARHMNLAGYRRLLEIASLNGLVEASQLSRALGGAPGPTQSTLFRILMEEYGAGRPEKKHSHYFAQMLEQQGMQSAPESYFECVPWEVLSAINHAFYLTEYKQNYLRFCGAFTYTELSTPVSFQGYAAAAKRLGLSDGHGDYWALHMREDERHGAWMVEQVALPLLAHSPRHRREVLFGYAQQRDVEALAGAATVRACQTAARAGNP